MIGPLYGLKAFSITINIKINDLPATSPHGKRLWRHSQIVGLVFESNIACGTNGTPRARSWDGLSLSLPSLIPVTS